jgi:uroporphyrinogen decarboxylase
VGGFLDDENSKERKDMTNQERPLACICHKQPQVMDVRKMKRRYGDQLCFYGGLSTQKTLPFGTVEQIREETKRLLDAVGDNGGLIASPAHDIRGDAQPENVAAMIEVLQNQ